MANTIKARYDAGVTNFKQDGTAVAVVIDDLYAKREARVYEEEAPILRSDRQGLKVGRSVAVPIGIIDPQGRTTKVCDPQDTTPTLRAQSHGNQPEVVIPVLTPDRAEKRQNGRRFKENGEESFTLTAQDRHGVAVGVEVEGSEDHPGMYVELPDGCIVYAVWYKKYQCYIAIRKLTPRECFRLQGWEDKYFDRAQFVNSDSQLYKQAGNGVTVNVTYEIGKKIAMQSREEVG